MAFGPKSKQRKARVAREIKHFAQRVGLRGKKELVAGAAGALLPKMVQAWTNHVMAVKQPTNQDKQALVRFAVTDLITVLRERRLAKRARISVASAAGTIIARAL